MLVWFFSILALGILVLGTALILVNGLVLFKGAPFLPSLKPHINAAFDLLDLKAGQTVYDLGCGDGRFLREAAKRGYKAIGYELNPFMFAYAWLATRRYRPLAEVRYGDFWKADLSDADAIFIFLLTKYMEQFDELVKTSASKGIKVASHTFKIPGKKIAAQNYGVYLYKY